MDVGAFEDLIDRLGEDLSLWPDAERAAALELLASSVEARALHDEARDAASASRRPPVRAPAGLADRIIAAAGKLKAEPVAAPADAELTTESGAAGPSDKVLPVLLLALYLTAAARNACDGRVRRSSRRGHLRRRSDRARFPFSSEIPTPLILQSRRRRDARWCAPSRAAPRPRLRHAPHGKFCRVIKHIRGSKSAPEFGAPSV